MHWGCRGFRIFGLVNATSDRIEFVQIQFIQISHVIPLFVWRGDHSRAHGEYAQGQYGTVMQITQAVRCGPAHRRPRRSAPDKRDARLLIPLTQRETTGRANGRRLDAVDHDSAE
jgi:hypothetical protein